MTLSTVYRLLNEFETSCFELQALLSSGDYSNECTPIVQARRTWRTKKRKLRAAIKGLLPKYSLIPRAVEDML